MGADIIYNKNCIEILEGLEDNSVDAIVTDPPYNLGFMGKKWDNTGVASNLELWQECLRVIKPGGNLLAFGGARTYHRMVCAIEDAGWQIRDTICWVFGSGFPKSLDISKAIGKKAGAKREAVRTQRLSGNAAQSTKEKGGTYAGNTNSIGVKSIMIPITAPATPEAKLWKGYGTALKPAYEPITVAMKPLDGTFAENCLKWGVGGLNIDGCRITGESYQQPQGRFPANFIHDGSQEVMELFPETKSAGTYHSPRNSGKETSIWGNAEKIRDNSYAGDSGSAARFFYCAKASKKERNMGCEDLPLSDKGRFGSGGRTQINGEWAETYSERSPFHNNHPTVKPLALMEYLVKLVTRPGHIVLDPFIGSGTTAMACVKLGRHYIGCELDKGYYEIALKRIEEATRNIKSR